MKFLYTLHSPSFAPRGVYFTSAAEAFNCATGWGLLRFTIKAWRELDI